MNKQFKLMGQDSLEDGNIITALTDEEYDYTKNIFLEPDQRAMAREDMECDECGKVLAVSHALYNQYVINGKTNPKQCFKCSGVEIELFKALKTVINNQDD